MGREGEPARCLRRVGWVMFSVVTGSSQGRLVKASQFALCEIPTHPSSCSIVSGQRAGSGRAAAEPVALATALPVQRVIAMLAMVAQSSKSQERRFEPISATS